MIRCSLRDTSLLYFAYFVFSPMDVNYRWSFLVGDQPCIERRQRIIPAQTYVVADDEDETKPAIATDEPPQQTQPVCYYEHVDNNILSPTHTYVYVWFDKLLLALFTGIGPQIHLVHSSFEYAILLLLPPTICPTGGGGGS